MFYQKIKIRISHALDSCRVQKKTKKVVHNYILSYTATPNVRIHFIYVFFHETIIVKILFILRTLIINHYDSLHW